MALQETNITHDCLKEASICGARMFKNVRGLFWPIDVFDRIVQAFNRGGIAEVRRIRSITPRIKAGLSQEGSSDLIGWYSVTITTDMVGKRIAIFTAFEIKTAAGKVSPEQANFIKQVAENGGISAILRDKSDVRLFLK